MRSVHFRAGRAFVFPAALGAYARFHARAGSARAFARALAWPRVASALPPEIADLPEIARKMGVELGWIRHPSDGSRTQAFDRRLDRVLKVARGDSGTDLVAEIKIRDACGALPPRILARDGDGRALVEELVDGRPAPSDAAILHEALRQLRKELGPPRTERIPPDKYGGALANVVLPWGPVHGDLSPENIWRRRNGELVLLDWEYARETLATYDAWHGAYTRRSAGVPARDLPEFLLAFSAAVDASGLASDLPLAALHVAHLEERAAVVARARPGGAGALLDQLARDARDARTLVGTSG